MAFSFYFTAMCFRCQRCDQEVCDYGGPSQWPVKEKIEKFMYWNQEAVADDLRLDANNASRIIAQAIRNDSKWVAELCGKCVPGGVKLE